MPLRQHHPPLPHLPRRMPQHPPALLPRRIRQRGTHPQLRQTHRHDPLAQGQRQHHPPDHRPAQDHVQGLMGNHRRQLRLGAVPRRQRTIHLSNGSANSSARKPSTSAPPATPKARQAATPPTTSAPDANSSRPTSSRNWTTTNASTTCADSTRSSAARHGREPPSPDRNPHSSTPRDGRPRHEPDIIRLHRPRNRRQSRLSHPRNGGPHREIRHPPAHGIRKANGRTRNSVAIPNPSRT